VNSLKTALLMATLGGILIALGWWLGGPGGAVIALAIALVINLVSYWSSDKIVLSIYRAREAAQGEHPELHAVVEELAARAGIPKPRVYIVPGSVPNAFATGRDPDHAVVAVTEGILRILNREELKGVLAHELSHIKHRDVLIGTVAATIAMAITFLASIIRWGAIFGGYGRGRGRGGIELLALAILAPLAAMFVQMAISRSREYSADEAGARMSGNPLGLADALLKLEGANRRSGGMATPATAHMFTVHSVRGSFLGSLFSTHPPIEERVKRLRRSAGFRPT
jgi:heat shock protein HtpX